MNTINPVAFFVYRRPESAQRVFDEIRKSAPPVLFFISDGPRNYEEKFLVEKSRSICNQVDWNCQVIKIFSDVNLGCKQRFFTALDIVFDKYDRAIILEDDCVPNQEFFSFCDWGLSTFENEPNISIVSGSNLHPTNEDSRNGFSQYMNCWGWATWSRTWKSINRYIGIKDIKKIRSVMKNSNFTSWEIRYWSEVLKHSICSNSIWDFYVQHQMLSSKSLSVYPKFNLIHNIGFDRNATHTAGEIPEFVYSNLPDSSNSIMSIEPLLSIVTNKSRDQELAAKIWSCTPTTSFRLLFTNAVRFLTS